MSESRLWGTYGFLDPFCHVLQHFLTEIPFQKPVFRGMPGGGFHEQVVQAVINVRDDLRASFCERFDGFHVLFGQYLQVFCPIGGPYGALHPA